MAHSPLEAQPHAAGSLSPVLGDAQLARAASRAELDAWEELDRFQGPGERRATLLALLMTPGSRSELEAWREACAEVGRAGRALELVASLSAPARPAALERVLHDSRRAPAAERLELLRTSRTLMCADGKVGPLDRLRWLYARQCLAEQEPGIGGRPSGLAAWAEEPVADADRAGAHALPEALKQPTGRLTSYLARMVPMADPQSKVGSLGVAWHRAVMSGLWGDELPPCRLPDSDQLVQALTEVQELSWMQRPLLARLWVEAAFALMQRRQSGRTDPGPLATPSGAAWTSTAPARLDSAPVSLPMPDGGASAPESDPAPAAGADSVPEQGRATATASAAEPAWPPHWPDLDALCALRLACRMIDTPLPPPLARAFVEHPQG
ncbi:MAG: hypothetical protein RL722_114 [Pseudomonadota bacterium]|jgi:hypothetical protein